MPEKSPSEYLLTQKSVDLNDNKRAAFNIFAFQYLLLEHEIAIYKSKH